MMSIVTESGSQEKFSFGEIKYRDDKTKLIEEIRLLNDQNKILKNRIRDSIREIKEREKDVQSWRSAYNLLARYIESQTKSRCDCEICQIHNSMPTTFTLADIAKSNSNNIILNETHSAQPRPSKDQFLLELGLIKNSERSQLSRLKLVSESHSSAYPNENFRKLSRRRFAKHNRNDLATKPTPTRSRYEFGNIPWPKPRQQTQEDNPSSSPAKKRQFLKPKQHIEEKHHDKTKELDENESEPPVAKRKKLVDPIKSENDDSLGDSDSKGTGKELEKSEMQKKVPGLSEVILATRVNNSMITISNNHNRGPKLQSRLNTVRNASSKRDKKPKRPPGRPHGSLTNMTPAKLDRKAKLSRLANNFELKNPKGGPKYHEAYSGTIVKATGSNGQKFQCYYCSKQYTVRQMVRFHTEEHHYDLAIAKLKELSQADKNIFKNMLKIPPLPD